MDFVIFIKGIILGLAIAAPVGPIAILCIHKTFHYGRLSGVASGLGAALADAVYGAIAAFGLTFLSTTLLTSHFWLRLVGGAFLIYFGLRTLFMKAQDKVHRVSHKTLLQDFVTTFFLTLTNPMTILSYLAIFAGLGLESIHGDYWEALWLVLGVFSGSTLWWVLLSEGVSFFREKVTAKYINIISRIAGVAIIGFGLAAWVSLWV